MCQIEHCWAAMLVRVIKSKIKPKVFCLCSVPHPGRKALRKIGIEETLDQRRVAQLVLDHCSRELKKYKVVRQRLMKGERCQAKKMSAYLCSEFD